MVFNMAGGSSGGSPPPSPVSFPNFGGWMADGGAVDPGFIYGVNDGQGREFFSPGTAGTVVPASKSGGDTHFHYNIDARGATNPALTEQNVRRGIMAAHADAIATSVQVMNEHTKRTPQR
jgi:hypothetical protein